MNALKAQWTVTAGVIPGKEDPKHTCVWTYTSEDYHKDEETAREDHNKLTIFAEKSALANAYVLTLSHPSIVNWVKLEFIWL